MLDRIVRLFIWLLSCIATASHRKDHGKKLSFIYDVLKPKFEQSFLNSCSKYPFFKSYQQRLVDQENQHKFVVFIFQQGGLRNGGFGGLVAFSLACRLIYSLILLI